MDYRFIGAIGAGLIAILQPAAAYAAGNIASEPTYLETKIDGPAKSLTGNDFELEVGKYYIWELSSEGVAETQVLAPELFRNSWFNQIVVEDKELHSSGAIYSLNFQGDGSFAVSFVPIRPGDYVFSVPGFEKMTGTFHVKGDSMIDAATPLELKIDGGKLAYSQTEFELETGKLYSLSISSDGLEELGVAMPELLQNSFVDKVAIDDLAVGLNGAYSSVEFDDEGTITISFVPLRPGNYPFYSAGFEKAGLTGTFSVR